MTLFVYGTLTFPEMIHALTGKRFRSEPATLKGYSVRKLADYPFPGLVASADETTQGLVLYDVDDASFQMIQAWEANGYEPIEVSVLVDSRPLKVHTYKWLRETESDIWDREFFKDHFLNEYVERVVPEFKVHLQAPTKAAQP